MANHPISLLLLSLVFAGIVWLGFKSGNAFFSYGVSPDRRRNPIGFWLIQTLWGSIGVMLLLASVAQFLIRT
jgi:hypothetical protein